MAVYESENLDSEVNAAFLNLAKTVNLPKQVLECLIHSGYDTIEEVAELRDAEPVEAFFRKSYHLFENSPKRCCIYGIYATAPSEFAILPGHASRLSKFINLCKMQVVNSHSRCGWHSASQVAFSNSISKCSFSSKSAQCSRRRRSSFRPSESMTEDTQNGGAYFSPGMSEGITLSPEPSVNELSSDRSETIIPLENLVVSSMSLELEALSRLKRKLKHWCNAHEDKNIQDLRIKQHYKIIVKRPLQVDENVVLKEFGLDASLYCCMCCTNVKLAFIKKSFTISNATRHLLHCIKNRSSRKRGQKKLTLQSSSEPALVHQHPIEDTNMIKEVNGNSSVEIAEFHEVKVQYYKEESSMEPAVVGYLTVVHSDHDYDNVLQIGSVNQQANHECITVKD